MNSIVKLDSKCNEDGQWTQDEWCALELANAIISERSGPHSIEADTTEAGDRTAAFMPLSAEQDGALFVGAQGGRFHAFDADLKGLVEGERLDEVLAKSLFRGAARPEALFLSHALGD